MPGMIKKQQKKSITGNFWNFIFSLLAYFKNISGKVHSNKTNKNIDKGMLEKPNIDQTKRSPSSLQKVNYTY